MLTNFIALTAGLATTASAFSCNGNYFSFFNRGGDALSYQRVDPGQYPGVLESPHLHSFDGANNIGASTNYAETQSSSCTTARVKTDKSLYWRPTLFWNGNNTGYYRVPEKSTKIYYKFGDGDKWANVTGFPEDFNMIAGNPNKRSDGDNPAGVRWGCHQPDGRDDKIFSNGFPTGFQSCAYGFASEVTFPSCWNGKAMDPKNPNAHMAYPSGAQGVGIENCPTTHRAARFPTIFIEFWYDVSAFDGKYAASSTPWVLSNGDPTGFGFHGDFLNGWEKGVLEKATAQTGGCNCGCGCGQTEMEQCFGAENVNKDGDAAFEQCAVSGKASTEVSAILKALPGCNPIQSGPTDATPATGAGCAAVPVSGGDKSSAMASSAGASKTPVASSAVASPSAKASSVADTYTSAKASSAAAAYSSKPFIDADAATDAKPSLTLSLPNKGVGNAASPTPAAASQQYNAGASSGKGAANPTASASANPNTPDAALPSLSLATTAAASKPTNVAGEECKAPVYVTITPTVYVTAGANVNGTSTSCDSATVTKTMKQQVTVTIGSY
jgi:hypothetical protein